ncbi:MAG: Gfo/Idh/MocA family oxidoreductase [Candidatus Tectomicrobia bacterium]|uniref:Gfo/Idh/MocA family oxidoreductase n=1 Tax=Tectimicrobiota bacterium TaxID=2528274 RepID=A0A932MMD2_UNCTE|nr:Gfo/Idh/MocA family oxidoreductase [Candidatus Tectomicrobia bacterium]
MSGKGPLGIAFIGLGWWGEVLAEAALASKEIRVTGGFARTPASREAFVRKFGGRDFSSLDDLLKDKDTEAVVIASANSVHREQAVAAARAGKHVHLEKPMALSVSDAKAIDAACKEAGIRLHMGQNFRRWPMFRKAKEVVGSGTLGTVSLIVASFSNNHGLTAGPQSMRWDPVENPGGPLYSYTIHLGDTLEYLFSEVAEVSAGTAKVGGPNRTEDAAAAVFRFRSGVMAAVSGSYVAPFNFLFDIHGTEANLSLSTAFMPRLQRSVGKMGGIETETLDVGCDFVEGRNRANREQFVDFARSIREGKDPEVTGVHGIRALAIMRAILKSHAERRAVSVDEILERD